MTRGLVVDLFAGGGGASAGLEAALGRPVDIAINHDRVALAVHEANHPRTRHFNANLWKVPPLEATGGLPVDVLWASPDCTHHSVAKGGKPLKKKIRALAWVVVRWARDAQPRVIFLENVAEFRGWGPLDRTGHPIQGRKGETFGRWVRQLERLGYVVEYRVLDASQYGAPTRRRRLFLVARRDGRPIRWPVPTHGVGGLPLRTAAECIDWSLPCPSIFERQRPLAEKTLWRIAQGIRRFVLEAREPFIVQMSHGEVAKDGSRRRGRGSHPAAEPLPTVTASNDFGLVVPSIVKFRHDSEGAPIGEPLPTVTAGGKQRPERPATGNPLGLIAPHLVKVNHGKQEARGEDLQAPLTTVTAAQRGHALVAPVLATIDQQGTGDGAVSAADEPLRTTVTKNRHVVVAPTLIQTGYGEREGQAARVPGLHKPLGTLVDGQKHALVSAFLAKHFGGVVGQQLELPTSTITAKDHQSLAAATLIRFNHDDHGIPLDAPAPTVTAHANHIAEVRAFLTTYYGSDGTTGKGQGVLEPMRTVTAKHRLGLVTVEGTEYQIVDIGMRMLQPHELLRAQFGAFAEAYDISAARTKADQVRLIGNSVCPEVAEAVVRANLPEGAAERSVA